jgi:hypothetical protein
MRRVLLAAAIVIALPASAAHAADRFNSAPLRKNVTVPNMLQHSFALQRIADNNNGTRVAGSPGNDKTVNYIVQQMKQTGWKVKKQPFEFPFFQELADPVFERTAPTPHTYTSDEFQTMDYSGSGDVTGKIVPVDVTVPMDPNAPASTSNSGCEAADFNGFPAGPGGSGFIEQLFTDWFDSVDQAHEPIPFDGRSDYVGFTDAGIPAGGIFTGAEKVKTQEEFELFGGTVGAPLDPCYHQACDTTNNLNLQAFGEMKDAAADVLTQLSMIKGPIRDGRPVKVKLGNKAFKGDTPLR